MRLLHLGCGRKRGERFGYEDAELVTLDAEASNEPDLVCVLGNEPIPLPDDSVDVAVAIHVLEHIGRQGETDRWFYFWEDLYRVMKPGGQLHFVSPLWTSVWCWADPQHVRALSPQAFVFFNQAHYRIPGSAISPYRIRCDFELGEFQGIPGQDGTTIEHFGGILTAIKPLVPWWEDARKDEPMGT